MSLRDHAVPLSNLPSHAHQSYTQLVIAELLTVQPGTYITFTRLLVHLTDKYGGTPKEWRIRVNHAFDTGPHRATALKEFMKMSMKGVSIIIRGNHHCHDNTGQKYTASRLLTLH